MQIRIGVCLLVVAIFGGGCSSDDPGPDAGPGTIADGSVDGARPNAAIADAAIADAALPDGGRPDAGPVPDAAIPQCGRIRCDCTFEGIELFGRVQYVDTFPDIQVRVDVFPDLLVREGNFADACGEWEIVDSFPDFTVEIVDFFEDFSIEYSTFPGIP